MIFLPPEIAEQILSDVDSCSDLLSVALVCRYLMSLVIPRQIEYRVLQIDINKPRIWAHLAERPDLACNIRKLVLRMPLITSMSRHPVTLLEEGHFEMKAEDELTLIPVVCKAIQNMQRLEHFHWLNSAYKLYQKFSPEFHVKIITSLSHCRSLTHVELVGDIDNMEDHKATQMAVVRVTSSYLPLKV